MSENTIWKGSTLEIVSEVNTFEVDGSSTKTVTWKGEESAVKGLCNSLGNVQRTVTGDGSPVFTCTAKYFNPPGSVPVWPGQVTDPDPETGEIPVDAWTLSNEPLHLSVWSSPVLEREFPYYKLGKEFYRQVVEDHLNGRCKVKADIANTVLIAAHDVAVHFTAAHWSAAPSGDGAAAGGWQYMHDLLIRGVESWENDYLTLKRRRTFSADYSIPTPVGVLRYVYTTTQIGNLFGAPPQVYWSLPNTSALNASTSPWVAPPNGFRWGWRLRSLSSTLDSGRVEQNFEWILASHSDLLYPDY